MPKQILDIDGDYLEGGGQILRTAVALSVITATPIRVFNIRAKRPEPGLKPQHLHTLNALREISRAKIKGLKLASEEIEFIPHKDLIENRNIEIDIGTAGSIGLALQPILLVAAFKSRGLSLNIKGGTCGLGAVPVDYYPRVIFPILGRSGLKGNLEILRRGYYPKGGGEVSVSIEPIKHPKPIKLIERGKMQGIKGFSIASHGLMREEVAQHQAKEVEDLLKKDLSCPMTIKAEYVDTLSDGSEINLYVYTSSGCILGADSRGELKKPAEEVAREAYEKIKKEILSGAVSDVHLTDNLIPWLSLLGGEIKASEISKHTQTNIWVCEQFFGKIFEVKDKIISVNPKSGYLNSKQILNTKS